MDIKWIENMQGVTVSYLSRYENIMCLNSWIIYVYVVVRNIWWNKLSREGKEGIAVQDMNKFVKQIYGCLKKATNCIAIQVYEYICEIGSWMLKEGKEDIAIHGYE